MAKAGQKRGRKTMPEEDENQLSLEDEEEDSGAEEGRGRAKKRSGVKGATAEKPEGGQGKSRLECQQVRKVVEDQEGVKRTKWICAGCGSVFADKRAERKHAYRTNLWMRRHAAPAGVDGVDAGDSEEGEGGGAESPRGGVEAAADASALEAEGGGMGEGGKAAEGKKRKPKRGRRGGARHARKAPCRDWVKGHCAKGRKCRFLHGPPAEEGGRGEGEAADGVRERSKGIPGQDGGDRGKPEGEIKQRGKKKRGRDGPEAPGSSSKQTNKSNGEVTPAAGLVNVRSQRSKPRGTETKGERKGLSTGAEVASVAQEALQSKAGTSEEHAATRRKRKKKVKATTLGSAGLEDEKPLSIPNFM